MENIGTHVATRKQMSKFWLRIVDNYLAFHPVFRWEPTRRMVD